MTDKPQPPDCSRRSYLRAGALTLATTGLAGCTFFSDTPPRSSEETPPRETPTPEEVAFPGEPGLYFQSTYDVDAGIDDPFTFTYDKLPDFKPPRELSGDNEDHPDSSNIDITIDEGRLTARLRRVATIRPITLQLWTKRAGEWTPTDDLELPANNDDPDNLTYHDETVEFTNLPALEPYTANIHTLVAIDPPLVPDWDTETPGRLLKTKRVFSIPYDTPEGRDTRVFDDATVNTQSYKGMSITDPTFNRPLVEEQADGSKAVFFLMQTRHGDYGVGTTISEQAIVSQNRSQRNWEYLIDETAQAPEWAHFQSLAADLATVHQKLGVWETLQDKLRAYKEFTVALDYSQSNGIVYHPTASLLLGEGTHCEGATHHQGCEPLDPDARSGINCTEKTLVFASLIQNAPLEFSGDDAAYILCRLNGTGHLIAGIRADKLESGADKWDQYHYPDIIVDEYGAPEEIPYIPIDVTNPGGFGRLTDAYSDLNVIDNINGDYSPSYT